MNPLLFTFPLLITAKHQQEHVHFQLQDFLHRFRNLTDVPIARQEVQLFQTTPEFDTNCVRNALSAIMDQCLHSSPSEIDPKERSFAAVKLSICEFEVAQLSYPIECQFIDLSACVKAMEQKSQWWTSYSGYYRTIGEICHQEQLPYEKDQVLNMFLGVTEHYDQVLQFLKDYINRTESFKQDADSTFTRMMQFMDILDIRTKQGQDDMKKLWDIIMVNLYEMSDMSMNITDVIMEQNDVISRTMLRLFDTLSTEFDESLKLMKFKFMNELEARDEKVLESIERTHGYLESLYSLSTENEAHAKTLQKHLKLSVKSSLQLNATINAMNYTTNDILTDMIEIKSSIGAVSYYLQRNMLARIVLYAFTNIDWAVLLLFISLTMLCFFVFSCLTATRLFRIVGILVCAITFAFVLLYCFLLTTENLQNQLIQ